MSDKLNSSADRALPEIPDHLTIAIDDRSSLFTIEIIAQMLQKIRYLHLNPQCIFENEAADLQTISELTANGETTNLSIFYAYKRYLAYIFEDIPTALEYADRYLSSDHENCATYANTHFWTIEGLIRLAAYPTSSPSQQQKLLYRVGQIEKMLDHHAQFAPENIQTKSTLLAAERCRVLGKYPEAIELYDRSIDLATTPEDLYHLALSNELAAKFYLGWGKAKVAAVYMQSAYCCYAHWGAKAKTTDLERRYPQLLSPILQQPRSEFNPLVTLAEVTDSLTGIDPGRRTQPSNCLDLASVLQSAQILSSTLDLKELLQKSIEIILTNSGAETCMLAIPDRTGEWQMQSIVSANPDRLPNIELPQPLADNPDYPVNTIYWVKNTQRSMFFSSSATKDLELNNPFDLPDRYLLEHQPQNVYCLPILKQAEIFGVVYLEHRQTPDIFTEERKIVISFLCSQAAIALENAKLYRESQELAENVRRQQNYLETLLDNIPHMAWLKDENRRYIAVNRGIAEVAGSTPAQLIGKNDFDFWPSELAQTYQDDDLRVMESGKRQVVEEQISLPNGEYRWLETIKTPIRNGAGEIAGTVGIALDITDRKVIGQELIESQQKYQKLTDRIPGAIYQLMMTPAGCLSYSYISSGCQELFNLSPQEVMDDLTCLINIVNPDDLKEVMQDIAQSAENLTSKFCEYRVVLASGELKWIKAVSRPERHPDGSIVWDGMILDVTDRKIVEQELFKSQQQYQRLADNIPGAIYQFRLAPDGSISLPYMSSGCQDLFDLSPIEVITDINCLLALTHADDLQSFQHNLTESARDLTFFSWEGRVTLRSGKVKWIELSSRPERQADGAIIWDGTILNITDRKVAEQDLNESQQQYQRLADNIPGAIYQFRLAPDGNSSVPYISSGCQDLFELSPAEIIADIDRAVGLIHPEDFLMFQHSLAESARDLTFFTWEGRAILSSGKIKWIQTTSRPEIQPDGSIVWDGVILDITEKQAARHDRQQAESALQDTNDRLEATNQELIRATQLKDEFLATMSHELRTPLNAILGMSECLQEEVFGQINERQAKSIDTIHRSGRHLLSLINDILDVSKIVAGKLELEISEVSILKLCESSLLFVKQQAFQKQIQLDIRSIDSVGQIAIDERRILQVLINLLSNAIKFTPKGGLVELSVSSVDIDKIEPERATLGNWTCLAVTDTGIGISEIDRDRLFQPFVQIDSALNRQYEGSGLGLSLVKQMVELHGGYVTLESEFGLGSRFSVYLPDAGLDRSAGVAAASIENISSTREPQSQISISPTILLAEDNQTNIITFESYLTSKGYRMIVAKNGIEAIALAETHQPDLILMDIQMPEMDGITAIDRIRQNPQLTAIPIIVLTAFAIEGDLAEGKIHNREQCFVAGANDYLVKPFKLKDLNSRIQHHLTVNS